MCDNVIISKLVMVTQERDRLRTALMKVLVVDTIVEAKAMQEIIISLPPDTVGMENKEVVLDAIKAVIETGP
jgi:hypothetical protein